MFMTRQIYRRIRIYLNEGDRYRDRPLYLEVLETLRNQKISGATVIRALTGFGSRGKIRPIDEDRRSEMPLIIEAVDEPAQVFEVLPAIEALAQDAGTGVLVTSETVEAFKVPRQV